MAKMKRYAVIDGDGDPCPRCSQPTQIREHSQLLEKHTVSQPFYYSRWFCCTNLDCVTTLVMPERYRVWNSNEKAASLRRFLAVRGQLSGR